MDNTITKAFVVTMLRDGNWTDNATKTFYQDIVIALDSLRIKRSSKSLELDETGCKIVMQSPHSLLSGLVNSSLAENKHTVVFVTHHSPIAFINMREFAEDMAKKHNIEEYVILTVGQYPNKAQMVVVGKADKLHLELTTKPLSLKECEHEYQQPN